MNRVAVVTGGTRGIGAAISIELNNSGYKVAAVFAGNEEAATQFNKEHGIPVYKIDVSDFNACQVGMDLIESEIGSVDILVNNAGITRDGTMHRMKPENWQAVIDTNLGGCFNMARCVIDGMRERKFGRIVNIGSINGQAGQYGSSQLCRSKIWNSRFHKSPCPGRGRVGYHSQRHCPRLC